MFYMKKLFVAILCLLLAVSALGCGGEVGQDASETQATEETKVELVTDEVRAELDAVLEKAGYEGLVYVTYDGKVVYDHASGTDDMGEPLTVESPMYLCSISKQFCAAAIVMLRDQGKLSLEDTLEKYFPEYTIGKDITLKNLLTMRSGIVRDVTPVVEDPDQYTSYTAEELDALIFEWLFDQPLNFEPDTQFEYGNCNYMLLSFVVEQVSGTSYEDFLRQNIFGPLGMTHSGFDDEIVDHPEWGLTYDGLSPGYLMGNISQGCGDIVTTAADLDIWMTALKSGQVVCMESYREMTTDYSPEDLIENYGYGLMKGTRDGWGHSGGNDRYSTRMYFNEGYGFNVFVATNDTPMFNRGSTEQVYMELVKVLFDAVDAAAA